MSMGYVAAAIAAISAASSYASSRQQQAQFEAAAKADQYNAAIQRQQAEAAAASTNSREEQQRRANAITQGKRAAFAAQSGTGTQGSNADFERQQSVMEELDALNIRYTGSLETTNFENKAAGTDWEAMINSNSARTTARNAPLGAASAALSTYASVYGKGGGG